MRTITEIMHDIHHVQNLHDRVTMEVGQTYGVAYQSGNQKLIDKCNEKLELLKQTEAQLGILEKEFANATKKQA